MNHSEVRALRERLGLKVKPFAKLIGCSDDTVYSWEGDRKEPTGAHLAILEALKVATRPSGAGTTGEELPQLPSGDGLVLALVVTSARGDGLSQLLRELLQSYRERAG